MRTLVITLLLCPLFIVNCCAEGLPEKLSDMSGAKQVRENLPEEAKEISGELRFDGGYDTQGALARLWEHLLNGVKEHLHLSTRGALEVFLLAMTCAVAESFCETKVMRDAIDRIGCCTISVLVSGNLTEMLTLAADTVHRLSEYAHAVLPVLFTTAAAGGFVSSSARFAAVCLSMDVFITASQRIILPLIYMFFALSVVHSLYENSILLSAVKLSKFFVTSAMTLLAMAFGAYLSVTGLIAGSGDALAVKTARSVLSHSLPVVGSLLSDSAGILLAAATLVKNTLGVFAMISVCALCVSPVAAFSVRLLLFRATAAAVDLFPDARLPRLIGSIASVFGMALGLIGCCSAILFISIVSGIKTVSPL